MLKNPRNNTVAVSSEQIACVQLRRVALRTQITPPVFLDTNSFCSVYHGMCVVCSSAASAAF